MIELMIIGNLTKDPESHATKNGKTVATFTVAADHRGETQFFRVSAWGALGETCLKYLAKGRKVAVIGVDKVSTYQGNDGQTRVQRDMTADRVEFLSPRGIETTAQKPEGFVQVDEPLPLES